MIDVYTQPEAETRLVLDKLKLALPTQPPPAHNRGPGGQGRRGG